LRLVEILIARAHRETVGLAHGRRADDRDAQAQVRDHATDDRQLLEILLAEDRDVRIDDVEQLRDDGRDAFEMSGTKLAAQDVGNFRHFDARRAIRAVRIDLRDLRHEHEIAPRGLEHRRVLSRRARIVREILVGPELHRVHEDARDETLAVPLRGLDETDVPGMQVAHRRHEHDPFARGPPARDVFAHGGDRSGGQHRRRPAHQAWNSCSGPG
jgi:hypothetical protein